MLPHYFIDRPVMAWVIAILIMLGGGLAITRLPAAAYPDIAPPQVSISAVYPGANADTIERTVTQIIEQQLTGLDKLLYFTSSSNSNGSAGITLVFENGTDPDVAVLQTQNRVKLAEARLPSEVVVQGLSVSKVNEGFILAMGVRSPNGSATSAELNNIVSSQVLDPIQRIAGVSRADQFGSSYSMRIWLNPDKLRSFRMSAGEVLQKVRAQNVQFATGSVGSAPSLSEQQITAPVSAEGRFSSIEEFENVILRTEPNGTSVKLKDVARVELGLQDYAFDVRLDGKAVSGFGVTLLPGANALDVADAVKARMNELQKSFPPGVEWFVALDATTFITHAIHEVIITLVAAVVLVFIVMLVFLQSFRATLIPTLVVPVALMGAFIGMEIFGFSINQLTLFGMVLAIGIVVDDAIVVIESVERLMREEHLSPRDATRKAMDQITSPIIAISLVLAAVFVPSAMQSGSVGVIYQQFALTIAISMLFSAFLALSLTPALCATLLRPEHLKENKFFGLFNRGYDWAQAHYLSGVKFTLRHKIWTLVSVAVLFAAGIFTFFHVPGGFVPDEDQGYAIGVVAMPPGSTIQRTREVMARMGEKLRKSEAVDSVFEVAGFGFSGSDESAGICFIRLKELKDRKETADEFIRWAYGNVSGTERDGGVFFVNMPVIQGLSNFGGFDMRLEDRGNQGTEALIAAQNKLLEKASQSKIVQGVRYDGLAPSPRLELKLDRAQAQSMGLAIDDVYNAIQLMFAPVYVNDFYYQGRVLRVQMQADAKFRMGEDALARFYLPSAAPADSAFALSGETTTDGMVPLASVVSSKWVVAPPTIQRFNGFAAMNIVGSNAQGYSSGEAMKEMNRIVAEDLPPGFGVDWAGQSLQEIRAGAEAPLLFGLSIFVVFLCLAALYESWATPVAVLLVVPVGIFGAVFAAWGTGLANDVFFKIGLITIIGLAAKNAILIVEFALLAQQRGVALYEAVMEAARLRLRPILMTSFAFILGVLPLVFSSGAGANARRAIGTGVAGGMLFAAILGVLLAPVFYVTIRRMAGDKFVNTDKLNRG
ncbi:MAG TPA: multidrug efflux RND transporter permease subunit [Steroidobacteraceae bacterium]|nr:multidrug efflux RND transporter permease subunit [Steroidobacteraceae bacterium]